MLLNHLVQSLARILPQLNHPLIRFHAVARYDGLLDTLAEVVGISGHSQRLTHEGVPLHVANHARLLGSYTPA